MGRPPRCRRQEAVRGLPPAWASRDSVPRSSSRRGRGGARARATRLRRRALEEEAPGTVEVRTVNAISDAGRDEWDACAGRANPFVSWDFLHCLEASGSATREEGWLPLHLLAREQATGELVGCVPLYLKSHSMGEYVFDQSWAEAHYQLTGKNYYPKLQSCVPFSPVTGPRLLARPADAERARAVKATLGRALVTVADEMQASSLHVTFNTEEEWALLPEAAGDFLQRRGIQYHWMNRDYSSFADFEMALKQKKRKNVRQERRRVAKAGLRMERLMGSEVRAHAARAAAGRATDGAVQVPPALWDTFYSFYRDTADRKWGSAYLTREFFHAVGEAMGDRVLLVVAREEATGEVIAGAINFVGEDTLCAARPRRRAHRG